MVVGADGTIRMAAMIQMVMLAVLALIILLCKRSSAAVAKASLFTSGAQATISVFGVVWMSATFMLANEALIERSLGSMVQTYPWTFSFALFVLCGLLFSQAATTRALMPLGVSLASARRTWWPCSLQPTATGCCRVTPHWLQQWNLTKQGPHAWGNILSTTALSGRVL